MTSISALPRVMDQKESRSRFRLCSRQGLSYAERGIVDVCEAPMKPDLSYSVHHCRALTIFDIRHVASTKMGSTSKMVRAAIRPLDQFRNTCRTALGTLTEALVSAPATRGLSDPGV